MTEKEKKVTKGNFKRRLGRAGGGHFSKTGFFCPKINFRRRWYAPYTVLQTTKKNGKKTSKNANFFFQMYKRKNNHAAKHETLTNRKEKRFDICFYLHSGTVVSFSPQATGYNGSEQEALQQCRNFISRRLYGDLSYKYPSQKISKIRVYDREIRKEIGEVIVSEHGEVIAAEHDTKHRHADAVVIAYPAIGYSLTPCGKKFICDDTGEVLAAIKFGEQQVGYKMPKVKKIIPPYKPDENTVFLMSFWKERVLPKVQINGVFPVNYEQTEGGFTIKIAALGLSKAEKAEILTLLNANAEKFSEKKLKFEFI